MMKKMSDARRPASTLPRFHASTLWVLAVLAATTVLGCLLLAVARAQTASNVPHQVVVVDDYGEVSLTGFTVYVPGTTTEATIYADAALTLAMAQPITTSSTNTTMVGGRVRWYGPDGYDYKLTTTYLTQTNWDSESLNASHGTIRMARSLALDHELYALSQVDPNAGDALWWQTATVLTGSATSSYGRSLWDDANGAEALTTLGVSTYGQTLVDDANAAEALATLGASAYVQTLLDDANAADFLTTLDPNLTAIAGLTTAANKAIYWTGAGAAALYDLTVFARTLLADPTAAMARTTLDLVIGSDVEAHDPNLTAISGLTTAADKAIYWTGAGTAALYDLTAFGRSILDDANEAVFKATVNLEIGVDVQAYDPDLALLSGLDPNAGDIPYFPSTTTMSSTPTTSYTRGFLADANSLEAWQTLEGPHFNVKHFGATGDGETDDTDAIEAAIDAARAVRGSVVYFPPGHYRWQTTFGEEVGTTDPNYPIIQGAGAAATQFTAVDPNGYVITMTGLQGSIWTWAIRDCAFNGGATLTGYPRSYNGIYAANAAGAVNLRMDNVVFIRCDVAYKSLGQLDLFANNVHFYGCDYAIWNDDYGSQHGGCQHWYDLHISYCHKPVLVLGGSQMEFRHGRIENNYGWAFFIKDASATGTYPLVIEDFWMEGNATWASEDVNGTNYNTNGNYYYFDNTYVILKGMILHNMEVKNGATVRAEYCDVYNPSNVDVNIPDTNSVFIGTNCTVVSSGASHSEIGLDFTPGAWGSVSALDPASSPQVLASRTSIQSEVCYEKANLLDYGWCAATFTAETTGAGNAYSFVDGQSPPIHGGRCIQLQLPANMAYGTNNLKLWTTDYTTTKGKWYLFTMDVKAVGEDGWLAMTSKWGTSSIFVWLRENTSNEATYGYGMKVTTDQWRRYSQLRRANVTAAITSWNFYNPHPTADPNYLVANAQFVEFDSAQQAVEYIYTGKVAADKCFPRLWYDDIALTADYTVVAATDNGATFTNYGASDDDADTNQITVSLPAATVGQQYTFHRMDPNTADPNAMLIDPSGSEYFRGQAAGKYLRLDDDGCSATIKCLRAGEWAIVSAYDPNMAGEDPFKWEP